MIGTKPEGWLANEIFLPRGNFFQGPVFVKGSARHDERPRRDSQSTRPYPEPEPRP